MVDSYTSKYQQSHLALLMLRKWTSYMNSNRHRRQPATFSVGGNEDSTSHPTDEPIPNRNRRLRSPRSEPAAGFSQSGSTGEGLVAEVCTFTYGSNTYLFLVPDFITVGGPEDEA